MRLTRAWDRAVAVAILGYWIALAVPYIVRRYGLGAPRGIEVSFWGASGFLFALMDFGVARAKPWAFLFSAFAFFTLGLADVAELTMPARMRPGSVAQILIGLAVDVLLMGYGCWRLISQQTVIDRR